MPTAKKAAVIDDLTEKLERSNAAALIEYRGLTVADLGELRGQLRGKDIELQVTKNTLLRAAAHRHGFEDLDSLFTGPTAVAFMYGDEAAGSKALRDYFSSSRVGEIKSGIMNGRALTAEQIAKLADLPNRETLLGQIAGLLESPMASLARLFNAPAQQFAYALAQFEDKGGAAGPQAQAATATSTAEPPTPSTPEDTSQAHEESRAATIEAEALTDVSNTQGVATEPTDADRSESGAATSEAETMPEVRSAQEVAADPTEAPESEGSASPESTSTSTDQ